jgi:hypothetical protein
MLVIPVGGGGGGIPFHGTNAYRTEKSGSGSGSSHATFYPTICIPWRQELFPPTYSACLPLIYRSYFPSTFLSLRGNLVPPTDIPPSQHYTVVPSECSKVTISSILRCKTISSHMNSSSTGTIFPSSCISQLEELFPSTDILPPTETISSHIHSANKRTIYFLQQAFLLQRNCPLTNIPPQQNLFPPSFILHQTNYFLLYMYVLYSSIPEAFHRPDIPDPKSISPPE